MGENLHSEVYLHIPKVHNAPIFVCLFVCLLIYSYKFCCLKFTPQKPSAPFSITCISHSPPISHTEYWRAIKMASAAYCAFAEWHEVTRILCVFRSGSRTDVPKRGAWSSWAPWAPGGTRFSGARGGWGRWWTGWSPGSWSPTGPSPTMEVCVQFS